MCNIYCPGCWCNKNSVASLWISSRNPITQACILYKYKSCIKQKLAFTAQMQPTSDYIPPNITCPWWRLSKLAVVWLWRNWIRSSPLTSWWTAKFISQGKHTVKHPSTPNTTGLTYIWLDHLIQVKNKYITSLSLWHLAKDYDLNTKDDQVKT